MDESRRGRDKRPATEVPLRSMNWFLPLETLPGWPEAPAVSSTHMLLLLFIGPIVVGAVIALLVFTPALGRRFRGELASDHAPGEEYAEEEAEAREQRALEPRARRSATEVGA